MTEAETAYLVAALADLPDDMRSARLPLNEEVTYQIRNVRGRKELRLLATSESDTLPDLEAEPLQFPWSV